MVEDPLERIRKRLAAERTAATPPPAISSTDLVPKDEAVIRSRVRGILGPPPSEGVEADALHTHAAALDDPDARGNAIDALFQANKVDSTLLGAGLVTRDEDGEVVYQQRAQSDPLGRFPSHRLSQLPEDIIAGRRTIDQYEGEVLARRETDFPRDVRQPIRNIEALDSNHAGRFEALIAYARQQGVNLEVAETARSQERQEYLYAQGRSRPGQVVTWTLTSNHRNGHAVDFIVNGDRTGQDPGYEWLQRNARRFGLQGLGQRDPGHIEVQRGLRRSQGSRTNEIHPDRRGGRNDPITLAPMTAVGAQTTQLPTARARPPDRVLMQRDGILPEMRARNPERAERMYRAIYPMGYGTSPIRTMRAARAVIGVGNSPREMARPEREDAFRLYLGLPQQHGTFSISQFKPTRSQNPQAKYLEIPSFAQELARLRPGSLLVAYGELNGRKKGEDLVIRVEDSGGMEGGWGIKSILNLIRQNGGRPVVTEDVFSGVMGNFSFSQGEDERGKYIAYYDRWDLSGSPEGARGRVGRPFEIYGRVYYDQSSFEPIR